MSKSVLDILVIAVALFAGGIVSVMDNPLTAIFAFLLVLGSWELAKYIPTVVNRDKEESAQ